MVLTLLLGLLSMAGVAHAATTAVHEITTNWVGSPATAPFGSPVTSEWRINTNDAGNPKANDPVDNVRVTLVATNGVFSSIPAICKKTGVTPVSAISDNGSTLLCNLGTVTEGTASVVQAPVRATGPVGSNLSVSGTATSDSAAATAGPAVTAGLPITGTHGMDLVLSAPNQNYQQTTIGSRSGGNRPSIVVDYGVAMTTGSIPGPATYSFTVDIAVSVAGQLPGLQWEGCAPVDNSAQATGIPYSASSFANRTNAPTCTISGSGTRYTVTLSGLDYSLQRVPSVDSLGNAIPSTSTFIASGQLLFSYATPITAGTGVTFGATPSQFTFIDGVTQPETNTSNNVTGTSLVLPGVFAINWQGGPTAGRSPWDANLWAAPGTAQDKTFPWPAAGSSTNPGPYTINDQPLASVSDSVTWSTYTGAGGADMAGSCNMFQNPAAFRPRYADFVAVDGASYTNMKTAHLWYRTDALNTKTATCGEPVGVAGSPWIAAPLPAGCATQTAVISPAHSDDQCIVSLPAGVTAVKMTWNPAVDKQFHHILRVWGYVPPTAPIGAESWTVGAFNAPYNTATVFPGYPTLNNYVNISTNLNVIAVIPGSTYGPTTNGQRDAMRIQGPTGVITKSTPSTTAQPGVPVTYNLTAEADLAVQSPPNQTFTVTDTLPTGMSYVAGSGTPTPALSTNGSGQQVLTYTFVNVPANTPQPITYQAQIPANGSVAPGTVLKNSAQVNVPGDNRPAAVRQATASVTVPNNGATNLGKSIEANTLSFYGDSSAWNLIVSSFDPVSNSFTDTIDILPAVGDGRGTTVDGSYTVTGVTAPAGSTVYYSTAALGSLSNDPRAASNGGTPGSVTGNAVGWTTVKPATPTAIRVIGPALAPGAVQNIRIAFTTPAGSDCAAPASGDNKPGQVLVNSANSIAGHTQLPMLSSATTTIGDCYALDLKKYVLAKGGNTSPTDPATNASWLDADTPAGYAQYAADDNVPFQVIVTNKGTGALANITVADALAPGCGGTIASLAAGATQVFSCQLTAGIGTTVNTATASVTPADGPALSVGDPAGFVVPDPYTVTKTSDPASGSTVRPGDKVTYTVTVTEPATSAAPSLNPSLSDDLSDVLDDATYNNDATASTGTVSVTGNTLDWSAAAIMPGESITVTYSVTVNAPPEGDRVLGNVVTSDGCVPVDGQTPDCKTTHPVEPQWTMKKDATVDGSPSDGTSVSPGETITYTVTATSSWGQIDGVVLTDDLSKVLDDASFVPGSAALTIGSGAPVPVADPVAPSTTLATEPFTLPDGQAATLTYEVVVNPDAWTRELINVVTGTATTVDPVSCAAGTTPVAEECTTTHRTPAKFLIEKLGESSDSTWVPMAGSSWAVHDDAAGAPGAVNPDYPVSAIPGETGRFQVEGIEPGVYWLEETAAPDGFNLLAEAVHFTVAADGAITLGQDEGGGVVTSGDEDGDGIFLVTVRDVPALQMPESGGTGSWPYALAGSALLLAAFVLASGNIRRRRNQPAA